MIGKPKFMRGDAVEFEWNEAGAKIGIIEIVDSFGTFEQQEEVSYDILSTIVDEEGAERDCLYKHCLETKVKLRGK